MGSVYVNGNRWMLSFKNSTGQWRARSSGIEVGGTEEERERNERRARKMLEELEAGIAAKEKTDRDERQTGPLTVERYAQEWAKRRGGRVNTAADDLTRIRLHVVPRIGQMRLVDVRVRHVRDVVRGLREEGKLSPRSIRHVYGALHTMFQNAVVDEVIESNPCQLGRGELPRKADRDPAWRATAVFARDELEKLISDERIPADRRMLYAILALTSCRFGETAALRWNVYDRTLEPLGCLSVHASYDVKKNRVKEVKTGVPRRVPVHPLLAKLLAEWKMSGWRELIGRAPREDDLIIPSRRNDHRRVTHARTKFLEDLERLGLRKRRVHDLRRTFISLCLADGARKDVLRRITHGAEGDIIDLYTTLPWPALCQAVSALRVKLIEGKVVQLRAVAAAGDELVEGPVLRSFYEPPRLTGRKEILAEVHGNRTRRGAARADHHRF